MTTSHEQRLRDGGLRVTRPRLAVLEVLEDAAPQRVHLPVSDIAVGVRARLGDVSTQAVYDVLDALGSAGLVRRVETAGSPARYESRTGDNHHHLVCRACGHTVDVDCVVGGAPCLQPSDSHGFAIDEAEVVFWGLCPICAQTNTSTSTSTTRNERGRR